MKFYLSILLSFVLFTFVSPAHAEAGGPDFYKIEGKVSAQLLEDKGDMSKLVVLIPPDTNGLKNMGCEGGPSYTEWQDMSLEEQAQSKENIWCKIEFYGHEGWVKNIYLSEGSAITERPTFDCTEERPHEIEMLICGDEELILLDHKMDAIYKQALAAAQSLDIRADKAVTELKTTQRGWIKERNECWKDIENKKACTISKYKRQMAYLQAKWHLGAPGETVSYTCNEAQTEEVVVTFYSQTAVSSAVIEYGDKQETFVQAESASGTRYVGDFGKLFWVKGNKAILVWNQNEGEKTCLVREYGFK